VSAPLAGVRVVVTRADRQAGGLAAAFAAAGAAVELLPLLEVVPPADPAPLAQAVAELPLYDWVVFTSTNAVHALLPQAPPAGLPPRLRLAAIGAATGAALRGLGVEPALVAAAKDVSDLGKLPQNALMAVARALSGKGFFVYSEDKNTYGIISSEGEMQVACDDGVVYTLRFGDVLVGSGDEISAGTPEEDEKAPKKDEKKDPKKDDKKDGGTENRYLMVSVRYDEALLGAAPVEPKPYVADA